jgi:CDP-diacylglycerol---glycerol-3-phosphate 3-phosphatidyltransferase
VSRRETRSTALLTRITLLRIGLVPVVMALVSLGDRVRYAYVAAAVTFVLAAGTDFVDGYLARRWALTTTLGSFLDTTADKLLVAGALIALVDAGRASPWLAAIIIGRELVILGLRGVVAADGVVIEPSLWGKLKANAQFLAIALAMLRVPQRLGPLHVDEWLMIAAAGITLVSAWDYLSRWAPALSAGSRRT